MAYPAIIGIDPSLSRTGLCVIRSGRVDTATTIDSAALPPELGYDWAARHRRMEQITDQIAALALNMPRGQTFFDAVVVIEAPAPSRHMGHAHDRSGLWWMIYHRMKTLGATLYPVTIQHRMRYATGKGSADKDAVLAAAIRRYPEVDIDDNNTADAVLLADIGARLDGQPLTASVPAACWPLPKMAPFPASPEPCPFPDRPVR